MRQHFAFALAALALVAGVASTPDDVVADKVDSPVETVVSTPVEIKAEPRPILSNCPISGKEIYRPTIFMITNGHCSVCDRWYAMFAEALIAKGWHVEAVVGDYRGVHLYPTFSIYDLKKWHRQDGFMTMEGLNKILGRVVQEAKTPISSRLSTSEIKSLIAAKRPSGWRGPVYADVSPRASAKQHLVGSEHGFSWEQVSGLSQDEALILHDLAPRHGNQIFPYRSGQQPVKTASSGCPNGGCPNQSRPTARWFRR